MKGNKWAFVMYPESMPIDWRDRLEKTGLPFAVSPLHDKDINPDGTPKKPHYHVITYYDNNTTQKNVIKNVTSLVNATIPIKLESMKGMYRYHLHLDNPEKYPYSDSERIFINNFDTSSVNSLTSTEIDSIKADILAFIEDNDILEYCDLLNSFRNSDFSNMLSVASKYPTLFNSYITSRRHKIKEITSRKKR